MKEIASQQAEGEEEIPLTTHYLLILNKKKGRGEKEGMKKKKK